VPFNTSSYISQFASYYVSTNGDWSSTMTPSSENVNYAAIGPNFQFEPVPEPADEKLLILAAVILIFLRAKLPKFNP
jgi:hypothetical protein